MECVAQTLIRVLSTLVGGRVCFGANREISRFGEMDCQHKLMELLPFGGNVRGLLFGAAIAVARPQPVQSDSLLCMQTLGQFSAIYRDSAVAVSGLQPASGAVLRQVGADKGVLLARTDSARRIRPAVSRKRGPHCLENWVLLLFSPLAV